MVFVARVSHHGSLAGSTKKEPRGFLIFSRGHRFHYIQQHLSRDASLRIQQTPNFTADSIVSIESNRLIECSVAVVHIIIILDNAHLIVHAGCKVSGIPPHYFQASNSQDIRPSFFLF